MLRVAIVTLFWLYTALHRAFQWGSYMHKSYLCINRGWLHERHANFQVTCPVITTVTSSEMEPFFLRVIFDFLL